MFNKISCCLFHLGPSPFSNEHLVPAYDSQVTVLLLGGCFKAGYCGFYAALLHVPTLAAAAVVPESVSSLPNHCSYSPTKHLQKVSHHMLS